MQVAVFSCLKLEDLTHNYYIGYLAYLGQEFRMADQNNVMSEMVGKWKLEKRDNNFEEFLSCRQVGWFLRKLMTSSVADVEYKLSQDTNTFTKVG